MSITRDHLERDHIRSTLRGTPLERQLLSDAALESSLREALRHLPPGKDAWLFGYGSLVWNPMMRFAERRTATLYGFHRGFYLLSRINRGTPQRPGLVLALDRGGCCRGVAYRIAREHVEAEFRLLWRREMLLGSYRPRWLPVYAAGRRLEALTFVANRAASGYAGRLGDEEIVACLAGAKGFYGTGAEYLHATAEGLARSGIHDAHIERLSRLLAAQEQHECTIQAAKGK